MMELTPGYEFLRKFFMVTGIIGAVEVLALIIALVLMAFESRIKNRKWLNKE